jgi:hypothetical protein
MFIIYNTITIIYQKNVQFVQHYVSPHQRALAKKNWHKYRERHAAHSQRCNSRYLLMQLYHHTALLGPIPDDDIGTPNTQYPSRDNVGVKSDITPDGWPVRCSDVTL